MRLRLDRTVKASDILTSLTIVVSVIALLLSWGKDREIRTKEQADRVRTAAARTLAKLERWQSLQLSLYQELQPVFVETSEMLAKNFDVIVARDHLWKAVNNQRVKISARVLDEGLETAYVDLFAHYPAVRQAFIDALARLRKAEEIAVASLLSRTQGAVLSLKRKRVGYQTAELGNALRNAADTSREHFITETNTALDPIRNQLYRLISRTDSEILKSGPAFEK